MPHYDRHRDGIFRSEPNMIFRLSSSKRRDGQTKEDGWNRTQRHHLSRLTDKAQTLLSTDVVQMQDSALIDDKSQGPKKAPSVIELFAVMTNGKRSWKALIALVLLARPCGKCGVQPVQAHKLLPYASLRHQGLGLRLPAATNWAVLLRRCSRPRFAGNPSGRGSSCWPHIGLSDWVN